MGVAAGPLGRLSVAELDQEIARVVQALDDHARADALAGFPTGWPGPLTPPSAPST